MGDSLQRWVSRLAVPHAKKQPLEEKDIFVSWLLPTKFRRSLEFWVSHTRTASQRMKASQERVGRNNSSFESPMLSGADNTSTSTSISTEENPTSQMVMDSGFTVTNCRHSP